MIFFLKFFAFLLTLSLSDIIINVVDCFNVSIDEMLGRVSHTQKGIQELEKKIRRMFSS